MDWDAVPTMMDGRAAYVVMVNRATEEEPVAANPEATLYDLIERIAAKLDIVAGMPRPVAS